MRLPTLFRLAALVTLVGLVAFSLPAQDQGSDDVAAAARKAREQQKNAPKPKKVITNDDIPSANAHAPDSGTATAKTGDQHESAQASDQAAKDNAQEDPKSEVYWRKRFKMTRDKLAQAEKELDVLQRELDKDQVQYYPDPQKALMQQYNRSDINEKAAKIDAKKKEIESLNQQLSDMEDDLRKAGSDPGWAR